MWLSLYFTYNTVSTISPTPPIKRPIVPNNKEMLNILIIRGIIAGSNLLVFYTALKLVPLSTFLVLRNLKGIFVLIITPFYLKERLSIEQMILIIISFIGTALIVNPWIFKNMFDYIFSSESVHIIVSIYIN